MPVLDAAIEELKAALGNDPVILAVAGIISPETSLHQTRGGSEMPPNRPGRWSNTVAPTPAGWG